MEGKACDDASDVDMFASHATDRAFELLRSLDVRTERTEKKTLFLC